MKTEMFLGCLGHKHGPFTLFAWQLIRFLKNDGKGLLNCISLLLNVENNGLM